MGDATEGTGSVKLRLGSLGIADLLWRVPEATPGNAAVVDVVLTAFSAGSSQLTILESVTIWALIGYTSFTLASKAYPGLFLPKERHGFRALFAAATITAVAIFPFGQEVVSPPQALGTLLVWLSVFTGGFVLYLHWLGWRMSSADDRIVETLARVVPIERSNAQQRWREELNKPGWRGMFNRTTAWTVLGTLAAVPAFLAAGVATILLTVSPFGELFFLLAVVAGSVRQRTRIGSNRPPQQIADLETYLYDSISYAVRSLYGSILLTYLLSSILLISLGGLSITLSAVPNIAGTTAGILFGGQRTAVEGVELYLILSVANGAIVLAMSGCAYVAWAGLRELPRLAAFIDIRQDRDPRQAPPRPVGFIIPGIVAILPFFLISAENAFASEPLNDGLRLFAIGWPLLLLGLAACWWITLRRASHSVKNEHHVIIGSAGLLILVLGLVTDYFRVFAVIPSIVLFGYFPWAIEYAHRYENTDIRQYAVGAYFISLGTISVAIARVYFPTAQVIGLFFILLGILSTIVTLIDASTIVAPEKNDPDVNHSTDTQQMSLPTDTNNDTDQSNKQP